MKNLKRCLIFTICVFVLLLSVGCGKKENKSDTSKDEVKQEELQKTEEKKTEEKEAPEKSEKEEKQDEKKTEKSEKENVEETQPLVESAEELEGMVDEFNSTTDPERKEELRKELEAILNQAEAMANQTKGE